MMEYPVTLTRTLYANRTRVVASKCHRNWFTCNKYRPVQLFKLIFFPNSPLVQIYTSGSDCKDAGNTRESLFISSVPFLMSVASQVSFLHCWFHPTKQIKKSARTRSGEHGGGGGEDGPALSRCCFAKKSFTKIARCVGALSWRINLMLVLYLEGGGLFLLTASLRRWRTLMCISLFTVGILVKCTSEFREIFEAATYLFE